MASGFQAIAALACAVGIGITPVETRALAVEWQSIDVLIDDSVAVSADTLGEAQQQAARIFARLEVRITWFDPNSALLQGRAFDDPAARRAFLTSLYVVRLVARNDARAMTPSVRALGFSALGTRVANIAYPAVEQLARGGGAAVGLLLGHVVAHELGHLLLRRTTHPPTGLMRATIDIPLAQQGRLLFTSAESEAIRARIRREKQIDAN